MYRRFFFYIVLLFSLLLPSCSNPPTVFLPRPTATLEPFDPKYQPWVIEASFKDKTDQQKAELMVKLWLDNFKKENADKGHRILEYTIDQIDTDSKWTRFAQIPPYTVVAMVIFSVKPATTPTDWIVGSGELSDGWVHHKGILLGILPESNGYRFIDLTRALT